MMRSRWLARHVAFVAAAAWIIVSLGGEAFAQADLPITYHFNDPNPRVKNSIYSVYETGEATLMVRHPSAEKPRFDEPSWYASQATDGELVRVLRARRPLLVRPGSAGYAPGKKERRQSARGVSFVTYDKLSTELVRGDDDREVAGQPTKHYVLKIELRKQRFDADGAQTDEATQAYEHHLWVAEHLPYSEAYAMPFRLIGRLFVDDDNTKLGEYILGRLGAELKSKLDGKGLVLRMAFQAEGAPQTQGSKRPAYVMEAGGLAQATDHPAELPSYPIIDEATYAKLAPVTIVSQMLEPADADKAAESKFSLSYKGAANGEIEGSAVWGTNQHGDFALLLSMPASFAGGDEDADKEIFLLLMRPMHGRPEAGSYQAATVAGDLESLSTDELEALSEQFTVMGVIRERREGAAEPDVYTLLSAESGQVEVSADDESLTGELHLKVNGVALTDTAGEATVEIEASFTAKEALDNVGSSTITQALMR